MKTQSSLPFALRVCIALTLAACVVARAEPQQTIAAPGSFPIVENPIDLTALVAANEASNLGLLETIGMEERTNVSITHYFIPLDEFSSALAKRQASADLPDIIHYPFPVENWANAAIIQEGIAKPIDSSIDQRTLWYSKVLQDSQSLREIITSPTGSIYMMPTVLSENRNEDANRHLGSWTINQSWLDNLNLELPATFDEFISVLSAFRDLDADRDGDPRDEMPIAISPFKYDTIPGFDRALTSPYGDLAQLLRSRWSLDQSGALVPNFVQEEYRNGLRALRRACTDGLLIEGDAMPTVSVVPETMAAATAGFLFVPAGAQGTAAAPDNYSLLRSRRAPDNPDVVVDSYVLPGPMFSSADQLRRDIAIQHTDTFFYGYGIPYEDLAERTWLKRFSKGYPFPNVQSFGLFLGDVFSFGGLLDTYRLGRLPQHQRTRVEMERASVAQAIDNLINIYFPPAGRSLPRHMWDHLLSTEFPSARDDLQRINDFVDESIMEFTCGKLDVERDWGSYLNELGTMGLETTGGQLGGLFGSTGLSRKVAYNRGSFSSMDPTEVRATEIWTDYLPRPTVSGTVSLSMLGLSNDRQHTMSEVAGAIADATKKGGYALKLTYFDREHGFLMATDFEAFDCESCERLPYVIALRVLLNWITENSDDNWGLGSGAAGGGFKSWIADAWDAVLRTVGRSTEETDGTDSWRCGRVVVFEVDNRIEEVAYRNVTDVKIDDGLRVLTSEADELLPELRDVKFEGNSIRISVYEHRIVEENWVFMRSPPTGTTEDQRSASHLDSFGLSR
ncbi:MAG: hypothetical protein OXL41_13295 [Nitrospinae bacterium]|nr:hypothetical protein [Nitrospinota bacterium]